MLQVKVNDNYNFGVEKNGNGLLIDHHKTEADIKQLSDSAYHIINNLQSYNVEVISFNQAEKTAAIKVNNNIYTVSAKDQFDILLDKLGLSNLNAAKEIGRAHV